MGEVFGLASTQEWGLRKNMAGMNNEVHSTSKPSVLHREGSVQSKTWAHSAVVELNVGTRALFDSIPASAGFSFR